MQAGGIARGDHRIAQMEVVAMLPGKAGDQHMAFLVVHGKDDAHIDVVGGHAAEMVFQQCPCTCHRR